MQSIIEAKLSFGQMWMKCGFTLEASAEMCCSNYPEYPQCSILFQTCMWGSDRHQKAQIEPFIQMLLILWEKPVDTLIIITRTVRVLGDPFD